MYRNIDEFNKINPNKPNTGNIAWAFQDKQNPAIKKHKYSNLLVFGFGV